MKKKKKKKNFLNNILSFLSPINNNCIINNNFKGNNFFSLQCFQTIAKSQKHIFLCGNKSFIILYFFSTFVITQNYFIYIFMYLIIVIFFFRQKVKFHFANRWMKFYFRLKRYFVNFKTIRRTLSTWFFSGVRLIKDIQNIQEDEVLGKRLNQESLKNLPSQIQKLPILYNLWLIQI